MASFGEVVVNYHDSLIRKSELDILEKNEWLNDVLIGFAFEYLENRHKDKKFSSRLYHPGLSQFLKMNSDLREIPILLGEPAAEQIQHAFWAVNDSKAMDVASSGTHWSLLVFSRPENKFFHYDSFCSDVDISPNYLEATAIYRNVCKLFSPTATFHPVRNCNQQANGRDCGLHVISNADLILTYINKDPTSRESPVLLDSEFRTATPEQAAGMREGLIRLIVTLSKDTNGPKVAP